MKTSIKYKAVQYYCAIFYILMLYKWLNGLFLYQLQPSFFSVREDLFTWLFMQTGVHQWLLNNKSGWLLFDVLFYSMPLLYFFIYRTRQHAAPVTAGAMLLVNWVYVTCYTLYPSNSIESYIAWLLFPIIFIPRKEQTFVLLFEGLRYFVLFFFVSAAVWKFVQGGIFNSAQMSGVLLYQHGQLLTTSPGYWQTNLLYYFIQHTYLSFCLYVSATILELSFIAGFFTKKYDRLLAALFIAFLIADYFVMRIPYFEISAFVLTLLLKPAEKKYNTF